MVVNSVKRAWEEVDKIFKSDYELDETSSTLAGYKVYRATSGDVLNCISDLGDRLEVFQDGEVINVWVKETLMSTLEFVERYLNDNAIITLAFDNGDIKYHGKLCNCSWWLLKHTIFDNVSGLGTEGDLILTISGDDTFNRVYKL